MESPCLKVNKLNLCQHQIYIKLSLELIGKAIKSGRTQQGIDTKTAAMLCDVSVVTLSKIENAAQGVRMGSILKVMAALGIKMHIESWEDKA